MNEPTFPIWDKTGSYILVDQESGEQIHLTETQVRKNISRQFLTVDRSRSGDRRILQTDSTDFFGHVPIVKRIDSAQPYCVEINVGDVHKTYMHVAERCNAHYDGRNLCIGTDGRGHKVFTAQKINTHAL